MRPLGLAHVDQRIGVTAGLRVILAELIALVNLEEGEIGGVDLRVLLCLIVFLIAYKGGVYIGILLLPFAGSANDHGGAGLDNFGGIVGHAGCRRPAQDDNIQRDSADQDRKTDKKDLIIVARGLSVHFHEPPEDIY